MYLDISCYTRHPVFLQGSFTSAFCRIDRADIDILNRQKAGIAVFNVNIVIAIDNQGLVVATI
jgi:hypothetical protein